jgi:hypothetical protein
VAGRAGLGGRPGPPRWDLDTALERIVEWHRGHRDGADLRALTLAQIEAHG